MDNLRIINWEQFQHFKNRRPPWIKLYREILDDPDWHDLKGDDVKALISLWLIASEDKTMQGLLPDLRTLSFRLRVSEKEILQTIQRLSKWISACHQDDIKMISKRYQVDTPETETETETEGEKETKGVLPDWIPSKTWKDFMEVRKQLKAPNNDTSIKLLVNKLEKFKNAGYDIQEIMETSIMNGWKSVFEPKLFGKNEKPNQGMKLI